MWNPDEQVVPCICCGENISPKANPCPHCGEPEAGVQAMMENTRRLSQEYKLEKLAEAKAKRKYRYFTLPLKDLPAAAFILSIPLLLGLFLMIAIDDLFDFGFTRWFVSLIVN